MTSTATTFRPPTSLTDSRRHCPGGEFEGLSGPQSDHQGSYVGHHSLLVAPRPGHVTPIVTGPGRARVRPYALPAPGLLGERMP